MTPQEVINVISEHFLCVRRLPFEVISLCSYREGDEECVGKPIYLEGGKTLNAKRSIVFNEKWNRKMIKEERVVENGGWWYVKPATHTDSTVRFNREDDKFFASTLEEAVQLYLNSLK